MPDKRHNSSDYLNSGKILYCSFCGKSQKEVGRLISGGSVFICNECLENCNMIFNKESKSKCIGNMWCRWYIQQSHLL